MAELSENLHRAELTAEQRDEQLRLYVQLVAEREAAKAAKPTTAGKPVPTSRGTRKSNAGNQPGAASVAAKELGVSKRRVNQAIARDPARAPAKAAAVKAVDGPPARQLSVRGTRSHRKRA